MEALCQIIEMTNSQIRHYITSINNLTYKQASQKLVSMMQKWISWKFNIRGMAGFVA